MSSERHKRTMRRSLAVLTAGGLHIKFINLVCILPLVCSLRFTLTKIKVAQSEQRSATLSLLKIDDLLVVHWIREKKSDFPTFFR